MSKDFEVALTGDFFDEKGTCRYRDIGLATLGEEPRIKHRVFSEHRKEIGPEQIGGAQGVIVLTPAVTSNSVSKADKLLVVARFGVGYDSVDVADARQPMCWLRSPLEQWIARWRRPPFAGWP